MMTLADYLRERSITQSDAARELDVKQSTISKICAGGGCSLPVAQKIYSWSKQKVNLLEPPLKPSKEPDQASNACRPSSLAGAQS